MQLLAWTMWPADDRSRSEHEGKRSAQEWALATSRGAQGDAPVIVAALGLPQSPREHASRMNAYTNAQALESSYLSLSSSFMGASSMGYCSLNGQPNSLALNAASNRNGPNTLHFLGMQGDHGMGAQHYSNSATPIRSFLTQRKSSFNGVLPLPQPSFDAAPTEFSGQYVQPSESLQVNKAYLPVTAYEQDGATFPFLPQGRLHAAHQDETSRVPNVQNLKAPPSARATVPSEQPSCHIQ
jgi:hypothetical protein